MTQRDPRADYPVLAQLQPGETLYTVLRHVSASGMSRRVSLLRVTCEEGEPHIQDFTYAAAKALGYRLSDRREGMTVCGCGFDAGFEIVYNLGSALWPNGTPEPHGHRNGKPDSSGGYALRHSWL